MKHGLVGILFLLVGSVFASNDKLSCTAKELARQDCRLTQGLYNLRLLPGTIAWDDGNWHVVDKMPLNGEAMAWEKISFRRMKDWPLLQLWLWDKGSGELRVQSLHWFIASAEQRKITWLAEGVVRRRRTEEVTPNSKEKKPLKFLYDGWEPYGLKLLNNGSLEWHLSDQRKIFERQKVESGI